MGDMGDLGLWSAFLAGLAASGHCASMCGGVAGALATRTSNGRVLRYLPSIVTRVFSSPPRILRPCRAGVLPHKGGRAHG